MRSIVVAASLLLAAAPLAAQAGVPTESADSLAARLAEKLDADVSRVLATAPRLEPTASPPKRDREQRRVRPAATRSARPDSTTAPHATPPASASVRGVSRAEHGDTLTLTFHVQGAVTAQLGQPYVHDNLVRLHLDLDGALTAPDSLALAPLAGRQLLAIVPQTRAGGAAFALELRSLGGYTLAQGDTAITLSLTPAVTAAGAASSHAAATSPPARRSVLTGLLRSLPPLPARLQQWLAPIILAASTLLIAGLASLVLVKSRRRRRARSAPAAANRSVDHGSADQAVVGSAAGDGRIWAAKTLQVSGASTAEITGRTGLPREAVQYLRTLPHPAESAASGRNFRAQAVAAARPALEAGV